MLSLIARRLSSAIPLLLIVSFFVFGLQALVPGNAAQTLAGGPNASPATVAQIRRELHLNDPFLVQYWKWLSNAVRLNFGDSLISHQSVSSEIARTLPVTLGLAAAVFIVAVPLAWALGIVGGLRPGGILDRGLMVLTSLAISVPSFLVAMVLVTILSVKLQWLPPIGYTNLTDDPLQWLQTIAMPVAALSLASIATLSRQVRAGLAETMQSGYIRTAWAKGGSRRQVIMGHAVKNSAIPAVTVMGLQVGAILGGTVIVEKLFSLPGMGVYLYNAIVNRDVPVVQAVVMLLVVGNVVANLLVDVAYGYLNPKVRS